jgi:hypothetical protein
MPPAPNFWFGPPFSPSDARIVDQSEDEKSLSLLGCANFLRCKQARRNFVAQAFKLLGDLIESEGEVTGHVFEKHDSRFSFADDAMNVGPQVARIILSATLTGEAERLARVARSEAIHDSTPRLAVEGSQIRPHRCLIQAFRFHARRQDFDSEGFPFNPTDDASPSHSQFQSEVKPGTARTEGEDVERFVMLIHMISLLHRVTHSQCSVATLHLLSARCNTVLRF